MKTDSMPQRRADGAATGKQARQFAVREIISQRPIASQDDLRLELRKRGFEVTQATLSRDMQELGVSRVAGGEHTRYLLQQPSETHILRPLVGAQVLGIRNSESMIVIRTLPGSASTVGEFIDLQNNEDIIGTVAGDNTLLVIPASQKKTEQLVIFLKRILVETTR